jgi:hypothetical protein
MAEELGIAGATTCAEALAGFVVSDDDEETAGLGLCEIWGGYVGNNVCPITYKKKLHKYGKSRILIARLHFSMVLLWRQLHSIFLRFAN